MRQKSYRLLVGNVAALLNRVLVLLFLCKGTARVVDFIVGFISASMRIMRVAGTRRSTTVCVSSK